MGHDFTGNTKNTGQLPYSAAPEDTDSIIESVTGALRKIRTGMIIEEYKLQEMISSVLIDAGLQFKKEYKLAPRNRIDFFVDGGIGIEVKKGRPNRTQVLRQLDRYTAFDEIKAVILVVERNVYIPDRLNEKKCILFGLNRLWGVALR